MVAGYSQVPTQSAQQQDVLKNLLSMFGSGGLGSQGANQGLQYLLNLISGSPESYQALEAPALRQFQEEVLPGISERLTAMGVGGGRSGGASKVFGQAGERLTENLAAQRAQMQGSAVQQLLSTFLGGSGLGLQQQPFAYLQKPQGFLNALAGGLGQGTGMIAGGGISALLNQLFGTG